VANVHKNAPFAIGMTHLVLFAVFYMFVSTAFVANVVVRDDETGFGTIIRIHADHQVRLPLRAVHRRLRGGLPSSASWRCRSA
jgi:hypothetical protein